MEEQKVIEILTRYRGGATIGKKTATILAKEICALDELPADSGIPELDDLSEQYNKGEISLLSLVDRTWNTAIALRLDEKEKNQITKRKWKEFNDWLLNQPKHFMTFPDWLEEKE